MTKTQCENLALGTILHHKTLKNADKTPLRARVNGKIKLWKTRPNEFRLPMKHGLRNCFYLNEHNYHDWKLPND